MHSLAEGRRCHTRKAAEEAGSSDVSKGFLEDVLSREEQKEIRNQLLTQFKKLQKFFV